VGVTKPKKLKRWSAIFLIKTQIPRMSYTPTLYPSPQGGGREKYRVLFCKGNTKHKIQNTKKIQFTQQFQYQLQKSNQKTDA
jgi:hypothetical protein